MECMRGPCKDAGTDLHVYLKLPRDGKAPLTHPKVDGKLSKHQNLCDLISML